MSTHATYDEAQHPRESSGRFAAKPASEAETDLATPSSVELAYEEASVVESRVAAAQKQIRELTSQIDADSAQQLGCFLRALHPETTHARLERDEYRWRFDAALDADGNELDIDRSSEEWLDCEDGIDTATGQFSDRIAQRPVISFNHNDGEPRFGDGVVVDLRPAPAQ